MSRGSETGPCEARLEKQGAEPKHSPNSDSADEGSLFKVQLRQLSEDLAEERKRREHAEEALRETHAAMIKHQQVAKAGNFRFNTRTGESSGSLESYKLFGIDPSVVGVSFEQWSSAIHPDDKPRILKQLSAAVSARKPLNFEYRIVVNGEIRHIRCDGEPDAEHVGDLVYFGVLTNVTERKAEEEAIREMERELSRAMRLAALGELAGSIVHEVSQPLGAAITSVEAAHRWLSREPPTLNDAHASLVRALEQGRRAAMVVSSVRSLVQGESLTLSRLNANDVIREVLLLTGRELERDRVTLRLELDPELPAIDGDRVQLQQVVLNLVRNAAESMLSTRGEERVLGLMTRTPDGARVQIVVTDTGVGFDAGTHKMLFTALFTTKHAGMGLGLSICRRIVQAHGGRIWAEPLEKGASFGVELPGGQPGQKT
jgi:C4-dicarboxylate-specific signal transduction histidine kinase